MECLKDWYWLPRGWAFCIVSASSSPLHSCCPYTGALSALVWSMHLMCGGAPLTQLFWTEWRQRLFVSSALLLILIVFYLLNSAAMLPLFLSSIEYFHADCSSELANCMPPPLPRPRCTRLSTHAHPYTVQTPYARVNQHLHSFIPHAGKLWNNLPSSVFPPAYDLNSFKRRVSGHLSSRI